LIGGWQESPTNLALRYVVAATVGQSRVAAVQAKSRIRLPSLTSTRSGVDRIDMAQAARIRALDSLR
jgi:hypothetical protein